MTKDELITNNINLIKYCIKKMNLKWLTKDEFQEYYDDGLLGLVKGSEQYDESKGKPSTYLYKTIKNEICRGMYLRSRNKRCNPFGRDVSLNTLVGDTNEQIELEDFIPDLDVDIEKTVQNKLEIERILYAVNHLKNEKNKLAIKMYFGLEDYTPSTYKDIAQKFNVSPEAIRVKVSSGIKKVREYLDKNEREAFVKEELKKEKEIIVAAPRKAKKLSTLNDLNTILFEQLSALNDEGADFEKEIRKSYAVSQIAQQIIANTNTCIKAMKLAKEEKIDDSKQLEFIGLKNE